MPNAPVSKLITEVSILDSHFYYFSLFILLGVWNWTEEEFVWSIVLINYNNNKINNSVFWIFQCNAFHFCWKKRLNSQYSSFSLWLLLLVVLFVLNAKVRRYCLDRLSTFSTSRRPCFWQLKCAQSIPVGAIARADCSDTMTGWRATQRLSMMLLLERAWANFERRNAFERNCKRTVNREFKKSRFHKTQTHKNF